MSFEGHYDGLCANGHKCSFLVLYSMDDEEQHHTSFICQAKLAYHQWCGAKLAYLNLVDDTNCDEYGTRDYIELTPAEVKTCDMGHPHTIKDATYKFSDEQKYWDGESWIVYNKSKMQKYKPYT